MPIRQPRRAGILLETGQTTARHVGGDGDHEIGLNKRYSVLSTGAQSGTVNIDVPHYAANTLAFDNATSKISDSGSMVATFLTGDTIVVRGSVSNDGTYTIATGGEVAEIIVNEAVADEAAGAYVSIAKRTTHSNNAVLDKNTGKMWARYTSSAEKVGEASDGKLDWYDAAGSCFTLHAAAADLQMVTGDPSTLKIVGGAGEIDRYNVGDILVCSGFANAVNNLPGYYVSAVAVNGADLDISLDPVNNTTVSEAAGGSRAIKLVCRSVFAYAAAANAANAGAGLANLTDWRVPNDLELKCLCDMGAPSALPDSTAFPGWAVNYYWSSTTLPYDTSYAVLVGFYGGNVYYGTKSTTYYASLVRR